MKRNILRTTIVSTMVALWVTQMAQGFTLADLSRLQAGNPLPITRRAEMLASRGNDVIAIGQGGEIGVSRDDGLTWTALPFVRSVDRFRDRPVFSSLRSVALSPTSAVIASAEFSLRSTDLETWNELRDLPPFQSRVAYGNGRYIISGSTSAHRSLDDGVTWEEIPPDSSELATGRLVFFKDVFITVQFIDGVLGTSFSSDGLSWQRSDLLTTADDELSSISVTEDEVFVHGLRGTLFRSSDGRTWSRVVMPTDLNLRGLIIPEGQGYRFIADFRIEILFDSDFMELSRVSRPQNISRTIQTDSGSLLAFLNSSLILRRGNVENDFESVSEALPFRFNDIVFGKERFVGVSERGRFYTSLFGRRWDEVFEANAAFRPRIHFVGDRFFGDLNRGNLVVSEDGMTWMSSTNAPNLREMIFANGQYVGTVEDSAIGDLATSPDGVRWTRFTPQGLPGEAIGLTFTENAPGGFAYLALSDSRLYRSADLMVWNQVESTALQGQPLIRIAKGGGRFLAITGPIVAVSENGIDWRSVMVGDAGSPRGTFPKFNEEFGFYDSDTSSLRQLVFDGNEVNYERQLDPPGGRIEEFIEGNGVVIGRALDTLLLSFPPPNTYPGWAFRNFEMNVPLTSREPERDPDRDGIRNLQEYALGLDPERKDDKTFVPRFTDEISLPPSGLTFSARVGLNDLVTEVEVSSNLQQWPVRRIIPPPTGEFPDFGLFQTPLPELSGASENRRFYRIIWSLQDE